MVPRIAKVIKLITISNFLEGKSFEKSIGSPISIEQDSNISYVHCRGQLGHTGI